MEAFVAGGSRATGKADAKSDVYLYLTQPVGLRSTNPTKHSSQRAAHSDPAVSLLLPIYLTRSNHSFYSTPEGFLRELWVPLIRRKWDGHQETGHDAPNHGLFRLWLRYRPPKAQAFVRPLPCYNSKKPHDLLRRSLKRDSSAVCKQNEQVMLAAWCVSIAQIAAETAFSNRIGSGTLMP